jgi:glycosyltransferase involved in cell wall biosynthesis
VENGKIDYIDLGVRLDDYNQEIEKIPGRCIFCSVPDRGLEILRMMWPKIKRDAPHASLVITADYRLWGAPGPRNHQHRMSWLHQEDVVFLGAIPRRELVREQLAAQVHSFPCTYEELFCISAAECQVAGALPVTSNIGALETTNKYAAISGNPFQSSWQEKCCDIRQSVSEFLAREVY